MAILWFLSCLALLSEAYGQSCRDIFLNSNNVGYPPYERKLRPSKKHSCGGSVLNERWDAIDPQQIFIVMAKNGFTVNTFQTTIMGLPDSNTLPQEESPVCLASSSDVFNNGDSCITTNLTYTCDSSTSANNQQVAGQKSTEVTSDNQQQVTVPILTDDECQKHWGTKSQKNEICTGLSSCMVDSGAGLLCKRNGTWMMAGIAFSSCFQSKPAMFTHMSAYE